MRTGLRNSRALPGSAGSTGAFDRLIAVGDAAHGEHLRLPLAATTAPRNNSGASSFTMIFVSKSRPAEKPEIFVGRPGVAVDAAVLAAAIGIDARVEADVGAVVVGDDALGSIVEKLWWSRPGNLSSNSGSARWSRNDFLGIAGRSAAAHSTRSFHRIYPAVWGAAGAAGWALSAPRARRPVRLWSHGRDGGVNCLSSLNLSLDSLELLVIAVRRHKLCFLLLESANILVDRVNRVQISGRLVIGNPRALVIARTSSPYACL